MKHSKLAGCLCAGFAAVLLLGAAPLTPPENLEPGLGPQTAVRTDAGNWDGTWLYGSRTARIALWIRTTSGVPEIKFRYLMMSGAEGFVTDWDGHAAYEHKGLPGKFTLKIDERDADVVRGSWHWTLGVEAVRRIETTRFTMYRVGDGRYLSLVLEDYQREFKGVVERLIAADQIRTFRKVSRREVQWNELPL